MSTLLPALLLASAPSVSIQPLDNGWFRLSVEYKGTSIEAHSDAQLRLIAAAGRLCKGKGRPLSEGTLNVDEVARADGPARKRGRLTVLSEEWRCGPAAPSNP